MAIPGKVFIACSLDGFIAREDGDIDWLLRYPDIGDDYGYVRFMETVDGLIMGRGSYEKVLGFDPWPYDKPVVVLSSTLSADAVPQRLAGKVRITDKSPQAILADLEREGWRAAYVDGGKVIRSFLAGGLITEMIVTFIPVLLGTGLPLFGATGGDIQLTLEGSESYSTGFVQSRYRVDSQRAPGES